MRRILFRGKRVDNGEWIYGYYLAKELCDGLGLCHYIKFDGVDGIKVIPETVGQFTGLTDRNGKEIYEGDVVELFGWGKQTISDGTASILFDEDIQGFNFSRHNYAEDRYDFRKAISNCVIVGNIHDKTNENER